MEFIARGDGKMRTLKGIKQLGVSVGVWVCVRVCVCMCV